jgi:hypothetical protein
MEMVELLAVSYTVRADHESWKAVGMMTRVKDAIGSIAGPT